MPTPTQFYSWNLPTENQNPWFEKLDGAFNAIDTTISSLQQSALPRATLVMSVHAGPALSMIISSASMVLMGADGGWTICSVGTYGKFVGSFSLVHSGSAAFFDLRVNGLFMTSTTGSFSPGGITTRWRLVVTGPGVSSLVIPSNSAWSYVMQMVQVGMAFPAFTDIRSLGPGNYSCELQTAAFFSGSSRYVFPAATAWTTLTVMDVLT